MSEITTRITAYRNGDETFDSLSHWLATRAYPKVRGDRVRTAAQLYNDETLPSTNGTWMEVTLANDTGLLTDDEYMQIVVLAEHLRPTA